MYGQDMWLFRDHSDRGTTRALNSYKGEQRGYSTIHPCIRNKRLTMHKLPVFDTSHSADAARLARNENVETGNASLHMLAHESSYYHFRGQGTR